MIAAKFKKTLHGAMGSMVLDVDLNLKHRQLLGIYGPSGAGKTSILRILAGLMKPEAGHITSDDKVWLDTEKNIIVPPQERHIGFVFQDYALFPHLTIYDNLRFALREVGHTDIISEVRDALELGALLGKKPSELSGGQKQRAALARAIAGRPKILFIDEGLSALDDKIRAKIQDHILEIHHRFELTTIMVSHNREEILKMADKAINLENGKIVKEGIPAEIISTHIVSGIVLDVDHGSGSVVVSTGGQEIRLIQDVQGLNMGDRVTLLSKNDRLIAQKKP